MDRPKSRIAGLENIHAVIKVRKGCYHAYACCLVKNTVVSMKSDEKNWRFTCVP